MSHTKTSSLKRFVKNLSQRVVTSIDDVVGDGGIIETGGMNRTTGATKMNAQSSRSHSILIVEIRCAVQVKASLPSKSQVTQ